MALEWWVVIGWATYTGAIEAAAVAVAPAVTGPAGVIYILRLPKILGKAGFEQKLGGYSLAAQAVVPVHMLIAASNLHVGPEMANVSARAVWPRCAGICSGCASATRGRRLFQG